MVKAVHVLRMDFIGSSSRPRSQCASGLRMGRYRTDEHSPNSFDRGSYQSFRYHNTARQIVQRSAGGRGREEMLLLGELDEIARCLVSWLPRRQTMPTCTTGSAPETSRLSMRSAFQRPWAIDQIGQSAMPAPGGDETAHGLTEQVRNATFGRQAAEGAEELAGIFLRSRRR